MKITLQHPGLYDLLIKKNRIVEHGRKLTKRIEALETERNKDGLAIQKLKDKIVPMAEEVIEKTLGEFDMLTTINIVEGKGHEIELEYINQVDEFTKHLREKKAKASNENTTDKLQS
jgi:hypothetical protein